MLLLGLFLLLSILLLLFVKFSVDLQFISQGMEMSLNFHLGIGPYLIAIPPIITTKISQMIRDRPINDLEEIFRSLWMTLGFLDNFLRDIKLFDLKVLFGIGDPFYTALGCGGLWAILGPFLGNIRGNNRLKKDPKVSIQPNYGQFDLQIDLHCIFQFRLGQIIINELKRLSYAWFA